LTPVKVMDTLCRLMLPELPQTIDPRRLARKGAVISGQYAVYEMSRLCEILQDHSGQIIFRLEFRQDVENKQCLIIGEIEAGLKTICQRCLYSMDFNIASKVYLGVISDPVDVANLPEGCEALLEGEDPISLPAVIEDELILAMPFSFMHEDSECHASTKSYGINSAARNNPFAVLKELKQNRATNRRK
jgi:Predicted metal-binding, possibly nucleic acid-binding protein